MARPGAEATASTPHLAQTKDGDTGITACGCGPWLSESLAAWHTGHMAEPDSRDWAVSDAEIRTGLEAAEHGETVDLGSFEKYASEDDELCPER